jgi:predicted acylesterase/phospholipase RssA
VVATTTTSPPEAVARARDRARELREATYATTDEVMLECDLVMKGGITSGVVYPLAACELARTRRFRSIGGSSAGAIAACLVAAAEYGRDTGGFNRLATLPDEIGPALPKLFTAGPHTRTAHAALMTWLDPRASKLAKVQRVLRTLLRSQRLLFWLCVAAAIVLALVAGLLLAGVPDDGVAAARFAGIVVSFALMGIGGATTLALAAEARETATGIAAQGFGICVGSNGPDARPATADDPGLLTDWLASRIDFVAGVDRPLIVSDLAERGIDLQVMTTNLTHGRPMCFPFSGRVFMFDPVELGTYFPPGVIEALVEGEQPATENGVPLLSADRRPLYRLPPADRLPVILAARISLSFPGLISAVPLYAVDFARKDPADRTAVRCWFSDGGITSNFPIHFFDSLWARRPTFAIDLRGYHPDYPDDDVYYAGTRPRQPRVTTITSLRGFASSILNTMQYWADDAQSTLPGYRDRLVEVRLHGHEGGMNLHMPDDVIAVVAEKGRRAAEKLSDGFDFDQHRWTRYLTSMGRMDDAVRRMAERYPSTTPDGSDGVRDLIDHAPGSGHYRRSTDWARMARSRTETLLTFVDTREPDFANDAPKPEAVLRITPRF